MKITINKEVLEKLLFKCQGVVERKTITPMLNNILINCTNGHINVFSTNLEVSVQDHIKTPIEKEGKVAVDAKSIYDIIKELPNNDVTLEETDNYWLQITQGKSQFKIVGVNPEEYVALPTPFKEDNLFKIDRLAFLEMIDKTLFSVSNDESRYHLNGVFLIQEDSGPISMVSTDGHRLSLIKRKIFNESEPNVINGVIIPRKGINEIKKLLEKNESNIHLAIEGSQLIVKVENAVLMIRLIEGQYPDYKQIIPKDLAQKATANKGELLSCVRRVSLLANQKSKSIIFDISKDKMKISSNNADMGEAEEELVIDYKGDSFKIGFNAKFIIDVLNRIEDESVDLHFKDELSPGLVHSKKDKEFQCLIMPMRV